MLPIFKKLKNPVSKRPDKLIAPKKKSLKHSPMEIVKAAPIVNPKNILPNPDNLKDLPNFTPMDIAAWLAKQTGQNVTEEDIIAADQIAQKVGAGLAIVGTNTGIPQAAFLGGLVSALAKYDEASRTNSNKDKAVAIAEAMVFAKTSNPKTANTIAGGVEVGILALENTQNPNKHKTHSHSQDNKHVINGLIIEDDTNINKSDLENTDKIKKIDNQHSEQKTQITQTPEHNINEAAESLKSIEAAITKEIKILAEISKKIGSNLEIKPPKTKSDFIKMIEVINKADVLFRFTQFYDNLNKLPKEDKMELLELLYNKLRFEVGLDLSNTLFRID